MKTNCIRLQVYALLIVFACSLSTVFAQEKITILEASQFNLESAILNETRTITVHLPDSYQSSDQKYPVLYLLDGPTHLLHASAAAEYLSRRTLGPDLIIVSIHNVDRSRDFSPVATEKIANSGGASKFLGFLSDELIPYMKENYRASDFSILMGHSFGGTFIAYTLLEKPELFDAFIAISPYLQYADNQIVKAADEKFPKKFDNHKYFYMTVGDEPDYFEPLEKFSTILKEKSGDAIDFRYNKMEEEDHGSIPYITLYKGLRFIFSDYQISGKDVQKGLEVVDKHYQMISEKYGTKIQAPENLVNNLGYYYLQKDDIETAISIFKTNVERYPKSANVYDSLGEAYEKNGQIDKARKNYEKAVENGLKLLDANLPIYKKNLDRVSEK